MTKQWIEQLEKQLANSALAGFVKAQSFQKLFPRNYRDDFSIQDALDDLTSIEQLFSQNSLQVSLQDDAQHHQFSIKIYSLDQAVTLSQSMSILDSMGLQVLLEKPYELKIVKRSVWLHYFTLQRQHQPCTDDHDKLPRYFQQLFTSVWRKETENDAFNQLLFSTCLKSRNINILRAYTAYLHQITFPYSRSLIISTLTAHPAITLKLIKLFLYKFDPQQELQSKFEETRQQYLTLLNDIESLDQDLIFKQLLNLINATVRTNYFQTSEEQNQPISFKFKSTEINKLPFPHPAYEIFIYSSRFEGIHLRGGQVARGGLRWSDRKEDYRTEVLGLMKAQMVKNAVIVPAGSKGGFITKQIAGLKRDELFEEVKSCYQLYITALLELTDNLLDSKIQHPAATRIHDQDDPYLVVAADKGTATFSDTANSISAQKNFWLHDAFASGGSAGYDHKKMGITARGAWESVKRHFRSISKDIQQQNFTVLGIGDMSGDVFGNGMLLSPCIQLIAAFNHQSIFIDPTPDVASSLRERQRLFQLPRSSWSDYNPSLISKGGGVFSRSLKKVALSAPMKTLVGCNQDYVTPDELITLLLKMSVELLWNGGIGTYVKASTETSEQVKDKFNDALRIDGKDLRAKVVAEGGNLGFTQLGRIEYAKKGGRIYTDSIDNSAGVDCSDHEVNLKIMLFQAVQQGKLTLQDRNQLLASMTDDVAKLCIQNNYDQTQIIDMIQLQAAELMHQHNRFLRHLESQKILNRKLEFLPAEDVVVDRIAHNQGLYAPELCILLSYSKLTYKDALLHSTLTSAPFMDEILFDYFPAAVQKDFKAEILAHPLKREIVATQLSNQVINQIGPGFGFRMREETGANIVSIAKAYVICKKVFSTDVLWKDIQLLDSQVNELNRYAGFKMISGFLERSISWLLRNQSTQLNVDKLIKRYQADSNLLRKVIPHALSGQARKTYTTAKRQLLKQGFPQAIAIRLAEITILASSFDIIEIKLAQKSHIENTAHLFFSLSERLKLNWIRDQISETNVRNHWHQLAIANMRNELHAVQRQLTELILQSVSNKRHTTKALKQWMEKYSYAIRRYDQLISELQASRKLDFTMASVGVFEVRRLLNLSA
ncbi:MAG: NAD-glutamate dehydrogenase [Gammaproteobacteria bacterium]|nr:NAD-glutamate dehydrogenase [Gammaproteobacteria bacterium]